MTILVPQGIGDSIWALHKVQDLARQHGASVIEIAIACSADTPIEARALEFISRFDFVGSVRMYPMPVVEGAAGCLLLPGPPADEQGYYRYIPDGPPGESLPGIDYVMMPNAPLERGIRLEQWLPEYATNWKLMKHFSFLAEEENFGEMVRASGPYVVFQLGSLAANTISGHNRGPLWHPGDWHALGFELEKRFGLRIVMVGAVYDRDYINESLHSPKSWIDLVGGYGIGYTLAVVKRAAFAITYQSGIGILASYFGVPTGIFWRPKGDSVSADSYVSFEEEMASAWVRPEMLRAGKHLPLIYTKCHVTGILEEIERRKWV